MKFKALNVSYKMMRERFVYIIIYLILLQLKIKQTV